MSDPVASIGEAAIRKLIEEPFPIGRTREERDLSASGIIERMQASRVLPRSIGRVELVPAEIRDRSDERWRVEHAHILLVEAAERRHTQELAAFDARAGWLRRLLRAIGRVW